MAAGRRKHGVRPHHRGRGVGRLRDRPPAGRRGPLGRAGRGGRPGLQPRHPPAQPLLGAVELARGLGLHDRAAAALAEDQRLLAARQGAGRVERAQRHDLHPRRQADFDSWAYNGALGWSYEDVLPYFKRSEDFEDGPGEYHGVGGPLPVTRIKEPNPVTVAMIEAAVERGVPHNDDPNADSILGVGPDPHDGQERPPDVHLDRVRRADRGQPAAHRHHRRAGQKPGLRRRRSSGRRPPVPPRPPSTHIERTRLTLRPTRPWPRGRPPSCAARGT